MMNQFPFDNYLIHSLPDYEHEWTVIIAKIVMTSFVFIVILPLILKSIFIASDSKSQEDTSLKNDGDNISGSNDHGNSTTNSVKKKKSKVKAVTNKQRAKNEKDQPLSSPSLSTQVTATSEVPLAILYVA